MCSSFLSYPSMILLDYVSYITILFDFSQRVKIGFQRMLVFEKKHQQSLVDLRMKRLLERDRWNICNTTFLHLR